MFPALGVSMKTQATHLFSPFPNWRQYIAAKGDPNATSGTGVGCRRSGASPLMKLRDLKALQPLKIHMLKPEKFTKHLKRTSSSNHPPSWLQVPAIIFPGCTKLDWLQTPWLIYIIFQWQPFCSPDWWFRIGEILAEGDLNFRNHLCKWPKDAGKLMTCGNASKFESCRAFCGFRAIHPAISTKPFQPRTA